MSVMDFFVPNIAFQGESNRFRTVATIVSVVRYNFNDFLEKRQVKFSHNKTLRLKIFLIIIIYPISFGAM